MPMKVKGLSIDKKIVKKAEDLVSQYFSQRKSDPISGKIEIGDERYLMIRAAALSTDFFAICRELFGGGRGDEADLFARNLLFDLAHGIGKSDARSFYKRMELEDPVLRLVTGVAFFGYSGWAQVEMIEGSTLSPDQDFYLIYDHNNSFESDVWVNSGMKTNFPVCIMNAGYSAGWCGESFGISLVASEILCKARGDDSCRFIMAPPDRIEGLIGKYVKENPNIARGGGSYEVPDLFSRKRFEDALKESELSYSKLFDSANDLIQSVGSDGIYQQVNKCWVRTLGYSIEEAMHLRFTDVVKPECLDHCMEIFEGLGRGEVFEGVEVVFKAKDGRDVVVEGSLVSIVRGGKMVATLGIFRDITERKRAEVDLQRKSHDLKERNKQLRCLYGISSIVDRRGIILEEILQETANIIPASSQYPEIACARILLDSVEYKTDNFSLTPWKETADIFVHGKCVGLLEVCYLEERPGFQESAFLKEEEGLIKSIAERLGKIVDRKRAEDALKRSGERFKQVAGNSQEWIWEIDAAGLYTYSSSIVEQILGYKSEDLVGKKYCYDLFRSDMRQEMKKEVMQVFANKKPFHAFVNLNQHRDGHDVWLSTSGVPILDDQDELVGYRGADVDITEHKRSEERVAAINKCFLGLKAGYDENVNSIARVAGEILGADCAIYNCLDGQMLCSIGLWNEPPEYNYKNMAEGHICYDIINDAGDDCVVLRGLQSSRYAKTDPNVSLYKLQTYIGHAVRFEGKSVGALCVVFKEDKEPSTGELEALGALAGMLGIEEARRGSREALQEKYRDVEKLNELMFGRERRVLELKEEINALLESAGKDAKYSV
jgi:PAS domain S-box-containing protein